MGKGNRWKVRVWQTWGLLTSEELLGFLISRATARALDKRHVLSPWTTAKRKLGKGARRATCTKCGRTAFVLPYGHHAARVKLAKGTPTIHGDALGKDCI